MNSTNGLVYLATPYTHEDASVMLHRFNVVNRVAGRLMREGVNVFSPISHSHPICMSSDLSGDWDFWKAFDRVILELCVKIIVLKQDGWQKSRGVTAEIRIADEIGLPIEYMDVPVTESSGDCVRCNNLRDCFSSGRTDPLPGCNGFVPLPKEEDCV